MRAFPIDRYYSTGKTALEYDDIEWGWGEMAHFALFGCLILSAHAASASAEDRKLHEVKLQPLTSITRVVAHIKIMITIFL